MSSIDGLITGIDSASVIEGLLQIQQTQIDRLNLKKNEVEREQASFKTIEAGVLSLKSALSSLTRNRDSVFDRRQATSSAQDNVIATADSAAAEGTFKIRVNQLATAEQRASSGVDSASSEITQGTLEIKVGNREKVTVTVDSSNNTLEALANSINDESSDVFASVINDGSQARLLLASRHTGDENTITITNNLADSAGEATKVDFDSTPIQVAQNAQLQFGSGAGAITVESESNTVEELVGGVTLDLLQADTDKEITITVERDIESAGAAITGFVDSFNTLMETIDEQTKYDQETDQAGILLGNRTVNAIQDDIRSILTSSVGTSDDVLRDLSSLGIQFNDKGHLFINSARLNKVLSGEDEASLKDIKKLFGQTGQSSHSKIEFLFGSTRTAEVSGIEVEIDQAASKASITGTNDLASSITIDSSNNTLALTLDGLEGEIELAEGTYTQTEFAALVESTINSDEDFLQSRVDASVEGGKLELTSITFGLTSELSAFSGTALSALGFDGSESDTGTDVVGRFYVNGEREEAKGTGQLLVGDSENENTADIQLRVTMNESDVSAGIDATLDISRGFASRLEQSINKLVDTTRGKFKSQNDTFDQQIESIEQSVESTRDIFESKQQYLVQQFQALESTVANLQNNASFLVSQLPSGGLSGFSI